MGCSVTGLNAQVVAGGDAVALHDCGLAVGGRRLGPVGIDLCPVSPPLQSEWRIRLPHTLRIVHETQSLRTPDINMTSHSRAAA